MKMCGAANGFIRWPFVVEGLIIGVFGAVVAFGLQWLIYWVIYRTIVESGAMTLFALIDFKSIWTIVLSRFMVGGVLIGACGSAFAIRRFLHV